MSAELPTIGTEPARASRTGTPAALLRVLAELMIEKNSLDVSFTEIAARSGHGSALIKYYFGSKDGMLRALALQHGHSAVEQLNTLLDLPISAPKKLRIHISGIITSLSRAPYLNLLVARLIHGADRETAEELADTFVRPVVDFQRRLLELGVKEGTMRPVDAKAFFFLTFGACDYLYSRRHVLEYGFRSGETINDESRRHYTNAIFDIVSRGVVIEQ